MNGKTTLIFPHIPKCCGTSLKQQFEQSSEIRVFFDYDHPPHNSKKYFEDRCKQRNRDSSYLNFRNFDLVFGHFPIERYKRENYHYAVLLREPLDRAISQFFYWKNVLPITNVTALIRQPIIKDIKEGRADFLSFIEACKMDQFYLDYLNDFNPSDFRLIGFFDEYELFLSKLSDLLNISLRSDTHERKGVKERIEPEVIRKAALLMKSELELYHDFRRFWAENSSAH